MSEAYMGEIRLFAGNYAPQNWALCDGRLIAISENDALFVLLGTTYGGDGVTTFALPDLRGRLPIGQGQGTGRTNRILGQKMGSESVTLTVGQLPQHTHPFAVAGAASTGKPQGQVPAALTGFNLYAPAPPSQATTMAGTTVESVGSGQAHNNVMPSLVLSYIICLYGTFPSMS
ncbi:Phage Tail Collar Domain [Delftia tsuruhatensis]|uniref:phage tail protein n=1 Tax=Delftia tsuruhatensis TaxID=180282 RepID=UPI001E706A7A|nr:tail fiber protein [Delftia tsuruhatensis]CAB5690435.1 Phage Tail Collar Domain [Delftia tsuruhatensis]CAC9677028.1 Phage Tail Collar Domain [Delftia tsuruhatensis]